MFVLIRTGVCDDSRPRRSAVPMRAELGARAAAVEPHRARPVDEPELGEAAEVEPIAQGRRVLDTDVGIAEYLQEPRHVGRVAVRHRFGRRVGVEDAGAGLEERGTERDGGAEVAHRVARRRAGRPASGWGQGNLVVQRNPPVYHSVTRPSRNWGGSPLCACWVWRRPEPPLTVLASLTARSRVGPLRRLRGLVGVGGVRRRRPPRPAPRGRARGRWPAGGGAAGTARGRGGPRRRGSRGSGGAAGAAAVPHRGARKRPVDPLDRGPGLDWAGPQAT